MGSAGMGSLAANCVLGILIWGILAIGLFGPNTGIGPLCIGICIGTLLSNKGEAFGCTKGTIGSGLFIG